MNGRPMGQAGLKPGTVAGELLLPAGTYTFTATMNAPNPTAIPRTETADARH